MKVLRSTFVTAAAIFAAVCGDKVNIAQPGTTGTPRAYSLTAATFMELSAEYQVRRDKRSVAPAVAQGAAICATSTVDANAKGCARLEVAGVPGFLRRGRVGIDSGAS